MNRVESNIDICSGKPVIVGTRILVRNIASMLTSGYSVEDVLKAHPELTSEDVKAALDYDAARSEPPARRSWDRKDLYRRGRSI
ncbi:MAG: DUF433 domain-containing protein [Bryobacteraceae bacterium]